ncbi:MAG: bifunctional precorrin-2 dehydrogenase/sirohydrochlorin ferrochelatase [Candidatus Omnitrophica bacterium]|nr:bifunctional precorrin-2 dehydrogenase/sirohydrochlorin ferrochelatase [Candidatus Omnitrophota bacterium]
MRSKRYYPISLRLTGQKCLVVGGGLVATRKVRKLLQFGAAVRVLSPRMTEPLKLLAEQKKISWTPRKFFEGALKETRLVFAATNDIRVNQQIARAATQRKIWVNVANPGPCSTFIVPAVLKRKNYTLAISTDGRSPREAKRLRGRLEAVL